MATNSTFYRSKIENRYIATIWNLYQSGKHSTTQEDALCVGAVVQVKNVSCKCVTCHLRLGTGLCHTLQVTCKAKMQILKSLMSYSPRYRPCLCLSSADLFLSINLATNCFGVIIFRGESFDCLFHLNGDVLCTTEKVISFFQRFFKKQNDNLYCHLLYVPVSHNTPVHSVVQVQVSTPVQMPPF